LEQEIASGRLVKSCSADQKELNELLMMTEQEEEDKSEENGQNEQVSNEQCQMERENSPYECMKMSNQMRMT